MDFVRACNDKTLFGRYFDNLKTWDTWLNVIGKALFAIKMTSREKGLFRRLSGRKIPPQKEVQELTVIAGRRSGKSWMASIIACYLALFRNYREYLSPGERGVIQIIASDRSQATVIFRYCSAILNQNPLFRAKILNETQQVIELDTGIDIQVMTCSFRSIRGRTVVCCICDEIAFWLSEGARPDREIIRAVKPAMMTIPNSKLVKISSAYSQSGVLYDDWKQFYGQDVDGILVFRASSTELNPTLDQTAIDRELSRDREAGLSEYYSEWRSDLSTFLQLEVIEAAIIKGRYELPFMPNIHYCGFVDPAGGGGTDSMTMGVAHRDANDMLVLDCLRAVAPKFDPFQTVKDFARVLKSYHINSVQGDKFTGEWCSSAFAKEGISYQASAAKSEIYLSSEPLFNTGMIELLDHQRLFNELRSLERRVRRAGRDLVDHSVHGSDDVANSACGSLVMASQSAAGRVRTYSWYDYLPQEVACA